MKFYFTSLGYASRDYYINVRLLMYLRGKLDDCTMRETLRVYVCVRARVRAPCVPVFHLVCRAYVCMRACGYRVRTVNVSKGMCRASI